MNSVRFILTGGVALFVTLVGGLVGGISILGGITSALELTRSAQTQQTKRLVEEVDNFAQIIEQDAYTIAEVLSMNTTQSHSSNVISVLESFANNKEYLNSITVQPKNGKNVWVGEWKGEIDSETWTSTKEDMEIELASYLDDNWEGFEDIYIEKDEKRPVITYTKRVKRDDKAFANLYIDLGLTTLSSKLSKNQGIDKQSIFVFDSRGAVIAHPSMIGQDPNKVYERLPKILDLEDPVAKTVYMKIANGKVDFQDINVEGKIWLVSIAEIKDLGDTAWYAVSAVPRQVILGPVINRAILVGLIVLVILTVAITGAWILGRSISKPLSRLANAAEAVKTLEIDMPIEKLSYFKELNSMELAFRAMLQGLEVFIKYVPKNLVLQLMQLESKGVGIKAEEREISILFTDIAGYTSISDGMNPTELAQLLNDYFETIIIPITRNGGTVDKFIGDAVMAFWNAPDKQEDHADLVIKSALEIKESIQVFNKKRIEKGQPPLKTRIGIHTGRVLVGNIGTTERMNYTIVGDAVNIASRLESLGKEIGETLCISEETKAVARDIHEWREVHRITLRGCSQETIVYTIP